MGFDEELARARAEASQPSEAELRFSERERQLKVLTAESAISIRKAADALRSAGVPSTVAVYSQHRGGTSRNKSPKGRAVNQGWVFALGHHHELWLRPDAWLVPVHRLNAAAVCTCSHTPSGPVPQLDIGWRSDPPHGVEQGVATIRATEGVNRGMEDVAYGFDWWLANQVATLLSRR